MSKIQLRRRPLVMLLGGALFLLTLALFLAACNSPAPTSEPSGPKVDESDIADFVGNAACAECHADVSREHQGTFHAVTLRPMTRAALGELTPPAGPIPDSNNALVEDNGTFYFEVNVPNQPDKQQLWPLDFAFGAGKHGITPVHIFEGRNVAEMKRTFFPYEHLWRVTPGKSARNPAIGAEVHGLEVSRACLGCHSVAMSKNTFVPRPEFYGVGCESCHGAGRKHIEKIRAMGVDREIPRLAQKSPEEINILCGRCHTLEKAVRDSPLRQQMTYRFHAYGLMKSPCYLKSGKQLSCLTCHDSHQNASKNIATYTPACLSCHGPPATAEQARNKKQGEVCPVNPTADCVKCHMPERDFNYATNEVYGLKMAEHRIGIYRDIPALSSKNSSIKSHK